MYACHFLLSLTLQFAKLKEFQISHESTGKLEEDQLLSMYINMMYIFD